MSLGEQALVTLSRSCSCSYSTVCPAVPILSRPSEDSEEERHRSVYAQARGFEHEQEHEHEQPISQQALAKLGVCGLRPSGERSFPKKHSGFAPAPKAFGAAASIDFAHPKTSMRATLISGNGSCSRV
jgi:hypothetical protein